ncbi:MAG TPA: glycerophosphodiester phosphodiesterase family protein [Nocardioidaceae bacterium]|jgi:glycerophosphoryl diester phosphodiesterase|nr:glycerophosphodiester phosphodiesterase family protein [Nocardioidaceae bacterium]
MIARRARPLPQVVAHRGASDALAEHTLRAYAKALADGADALECDVRLTADGHLICVHDRRIDRTSNGRGAVSTLALAELERWDFETWKHPWADLDDERDDADTPPGVVLTLEQLCGMVADYERPVQLAIETKHPTRYAALVERRLVELLDRFGWTRPRRDEPPRVRVMSFARASLRRVRQWAPHVPTVFLMDSVPRLLRGGGLPLDVRITGPSIDIVRAHPSYVRRAQQAGHAVHVWVVNDPADLGLCYELEVDAVITDRPSETVDLLRSWA